MEPFLLKRLRNVLYQKTNLLVVQSEYSLNYFSSIVKKSKICILDNPMDASLFKKINTNVEETFCTYYWCEYGLVGTDLLENIERDYEVYEDI